MAIQLKNSSNVTQYEFPHGCKVVAEPWSKRQDSEPRAYQNGSTRTGDEKVNERIISIHGIFNVDDVNATYGATLSANLKEMKQQCNTEDLRLYLSTAYPDEFYEVELFNFEQTFLGTITIAEIYIDFQVVKPFRFYKDATTDTSYLSDCLSLTGAGYASIADGSQAGLDLGFSDFILEAWVNTTSTAKQGIIYKSGAGGYYNFHINVTTGYLECVVNDGANTATITGDVAINDGDWHYVVFTFDGSSATGGRLYVDATEDESARTDVTSILNIDNDGAFYIGYDGTDELVGKIDEPHIWNFGIDGLPVDIADYITWRYSNPYAALSSYDSDAWAGWADAVRTEAITAGALDDDNGDFETAGVDGTDIETNTDWTKSNTSAETDNEAGSGVNTYNGSDFCCKIHTGTDDYPSMVISGADFEAAFTAGEWYEVSYDYKVAAVTDGYVRIRDGDALDEGKALDSESWATDRFLFQVGQTAGMRIDVYSHNGTDEDGDEIVYIDNISIKRVGLVAHYKFDDGYTDETTNSNDLTAGGSGNTFPVDSIPDGHPLAISNDGDEAAYPVITWTGSTDTAITNIRMTNAEDGGKYFDYAGSVGDADVVEIDCLEGTVELNGTSDIDNFTGAFIKLASGTNNVTITITGTTGGPNTCTFVFRKKYL